jgi:peptidoglycan/LPS O-acetylase OafA/YrhL
MIETSTALRRDRGKRSRTRPEIQALRAIAVLAVVLYHLWPTRLTGGFVGVDIFFAISGYLIIGHLLREAGNTGRVSLVQFWARRARRLLPASLLVLAVSGVAIAVFVPQVLWREWFQEIGASALYVQNWLLAGNAVDYLGADNAASPAQHYWSLSAEEQFYIVWPILIVVVLAIARRRAGLYRTLVGVLLAVVTLASLSYSIYEVATNPAAAYFVTPARAWEFGAGGLLAYFTTIPLRGREQLKTVVSWLGLLLILASLTLYTPQTPFPGATALLPVVGTLLVIWAGMPATSWSPGIILSFRPVTWVGDISYSLYLWHWPPIILLPFVLGHQLGIRDRLGILVLAIAAAWLTKKLVEDPVRLGRLLVARPAWVSLTACLAASVVVVGGSGVAYGAAQTSITRQADAVKKAVQSPSNCVGAPAALPNSGCAKPYAVTTLTDPTFAETDIGKGVQVTDTCKQTLTDSAIIACRIGDLKNPAETIALVGDSHAGQFLEALDLYGQSHGIEFITYIKTLCAATGSPVVSSLTEASAVAIDSCADWGRHVLSSIAANSRISSVIFSNYTSTYLGGAVPGLHRPLASEDFVTAWRGLIAAGKQVIAIRDTPNANFVNVPQCIAQHLDQYDPCATPRDESQLPAAQDPVLVAAKELPAVKLIDLTDNFCDATTCHELIGGLIVYFDDEHMTSTFSKTLAPIIGADVRKAIASR